MFIDSEVSEFVNEIFGDDLKWHYGNLLQHDGPWFDISDLYVVEVFEIIFDTAQIQLILICESSMGYAWGLLIL
jgi:hypothetical protein